MSVTSIFYEQNTFGISRFDEQSQTISASQLSIIPKDKDSILQILFDLDDLQTLLVSSSFNQNFQQQMQDEYFRSKGKILSVQRVMNQEFNFERSISQLLEIEFHSQHNERNHQKNSINIEQYPSQTIEDHFIQKNSLSKYEILSQVIDLECKNMVKSLGGLLCYLKNSQKIDKSFNINKIFFDRNFNNHIHFNKQSLTYLSIFKEEIHPSMIKGKGKAKEGFSLFMLFSKFIFTKQGLNKLKHLFLSPSCCSSLLKKRNQSISFFYSLSQESIRQIKQSLQKCTNVNKILNKIKEVSMNFNDWYNLKRTLESSIKLVSLILGEAEFQNTRNNIVFGEDLCEQSLSELAKLNQFLDRYLEFSYKEGEITIKQGIIHELDNLLKDYENINEILEYYTKQEYDRLKLHSTSFSSQIIIQYFPQLGYFITVEKLRQQQQLIDSSLGEGATSFQSFQKGNQKIHYSSEQSIKRRSSGSHLKDISAESFTEEDQLQTNSDLCNLQFICNILSVNQLASTVFIKIQTTLGEMSAVKASYRENKIMKKILEYGLLDDYCYCFSLQDALLFKNDLCNELDEKYGDIQSRIIDIQRDILREIEQQIMLYADELVKTSKFIGDLDLYFCLYQAAEVYNLRKPQLVEESTLILYEIRNLLTELTIGEKQFVSNSFCVYNFSNSQVDKNIKTQSVLNNQFSNRFCFLTGPNYSGKSVFVKSIGMICYLAHIGSFVPCRFARIGILDGIYITTPQHDSVLKFNGETAEQIQILNHILYQATNRSLILIDEFGKNLRLDESLLINRALIKCLTQDNFVNCQQDSDTSSIYQQEENISSDHLMIHEQIQSNDMFSSLIQFKEQYNRIPITIMASHLNQLFNYIDFQENYILRFLHMEVLIEDGRNLLKISELQKELNSSQQIVHIYKLKQGIAKSSCAALVTKSIIKNNKNLISRIFEIHDCVQKGQLEIKKREAIEMAHQFKTSIIIEQIEQLMLSENNKIA